MAAAAAISTTCCSFSPRALAAAPRPNPRNPPKISSKRPSRNPNPNLKSSSTAHKSRRPPPSSAVEATTYTRLPPKEDFFTPSIESLLHLSTEVKLSESTTVIDRNANVSDIEEDDDIEEDGDIELGLDYGKFDVFDEEFDSESEDRGEHSENVFEGCGEDEEEAEEEDGKEKEKGVPAVMRCFDRAKIFVKAGDGGNGVVAFRREKYVPFGGPSGGDGGKGGNVYVEVDAAMNSLLPFRKSIHFRAGRGAHGQGRLQGGARGEDVVVKVPPGTVVREGRDDGVEGMVLLELLHPGQKALLLPGGRGGRGNASFKSGTNKVPKIAENGEEGPEM